MDFAVCDTFFNDVIIFILVSHFTPAFPGVEPESTMQKINELVEVWYERGSRDPLCVDAAINLSTPPAIGMVQLSVQPAWVYC